MVEWKGDFVNFAPRRIWVTTVHSPAAFSPMGEDEKQLLRRLDRIIEYYPDEVIVHKGPEVAPWMQVELVGKRSVPESEEEMEEISEDTQGELSVFRKRFRVD